VVDVDGDDARRGHGRGRFLAADHDHAGVAGPALDGDRLGGRARGASASAAAAGGSGAGARPMTAGSRSGGSCPSACAAAVLNRLAGVAIPMAWCGPRGVVLSNPSVVREHLARYPEPAERYGERQAGRPGRPPEPGNTERTSSDPCPQPQPERPGR
jgi:hypothetical protein